MVRALSSLRSEIRDYMDAYIIWTYIWMLYEPMRLMHIYTLCMSLKEI